jgi:hypothetical protein
LTAWTVVPAIGRAVFSLEAREVNGFVLVLDFSVGAHKDLHRETTNRLLVEVNVNILELQAQR